MKLYLMRHGAAEDARPGMYDRDRQLTSDGIETTKHEARALKDASLKLDLILTSPYPRARQTAEIVAKALDLTDRLVADERLSCGAGLGDLQELMSDHPTTQRVMVVGHNPDLPMMAGRLVGGAAINLKKGGIIHIETASIEPGAGILEWIATPALLTRR